MTDGMKITVDDVRKAGHCVRGAKDWFDRHNLDFRKFVKEGIPADEFLSSGDAIAQTIVNKKIERESK